ncbi:MAG: dihydrofolate reductase [Acholeplasmataceae bacterium]|nr:dihydrofolate reductase [Acholeplasmataceae bacterium]
MIKMIWAMDENHLIGKGNLLPWHYPKDLEYFKQMTASIPVLMGDMTYQSLKSYYRKKPLPFQKIYVANLEDAKYEDATRIEDIHQFLKEFTEDIMVIGGKTIYQLALPYADKLYITYVLKAYQGDVYFPHFDLNQFKLTWYKTEEQLIFSEYTRITS